MWKEYSKGKPTKEEHQYLVKEIISNSKMEDIAKFNKLYWIDLTEADKEWS